MINKSFCFFFQKEALLLPFVFKSRPLPSHREILRVGVQNDDGAGGLFGVELVFVREGHADAFGVEEAEEKTLVLEVRAGGVAEGVA